jgi:hypothetical protein
MAKDKRTIMQMEIHPDLIRLRKERKKRLKEQYEGAQNVYGLKEQYEGAQNVYGQVSPFRHAPMSLSEALFGRLQ